MTKLLLITFLLLTGCARPVVCIEGKLWSNSDPLSFGNVYVATNTECKEVK